ncbi:MAG TPA: RNA-binding protein [Firmicutes bacterium]|nr:RNA-binding protein [Bacillota bacterium]
MVKTTGTEPRLGQKVLSKQGRDAGATFLIVGLQSDDYVLVADGQKRSINRPKKKNRKHLSLTLQVAEEIAAKLTTGVRVTDEEIVDAIRRLGEN